MFWPRICFRTSKTVTNIFFFVFSLYLIYVNINLFQVPVIDFEVHSDRPGMFQVFWSGTKGHYRQKDSVFQRDITPSKTHYSIELRDPKGIVFGPNIQYLRIDPLDRPGRILIKDIRIKQGGLFSIDLSSRKDFKNIKAIDGIQNMKVLKDGLMVVTDTNDPKLEIRVTPIPNYGTIASFVLGCLLLLYSLKNLSLKFQRLQYIEWLFFFVFALILTMAVLTGPDMHPDEFVHRSAAEYYSQHNNWLPPAADDPAILETYSSHGVSRLNSREIVYLVAGKFLEVFSFLPVNHYLLLRFFNISLFALLLIYCFRNPDLRIVSLPIFISPQIWYIFCYFNSDAFALFILFMITYQVLKVDSLFNKYIRCERNSFSTFIQCIVFGLLFSFLFLIKKNFYFFIIFLGLYFSLQFYKRNYSDPGLIFKRLGTVFITIICLFSVHYTLHSAVNNWHRTENIVKMQNKTADVDLNPLNNPKDTNKFLNLRGEGFPLSYVWKDLQWGHITFMSTFGVYGNMAIYNTIPFYQSIRLLLILFSICILYDLLCSRERDGSFLLLLMVIGCSAALIAASFLNSWIADYQPQGRYLLPIVPMAAFFLYTAHRRLLLGRISFFVLVLFLFSAYSFVFLGLADIPKV